MGEAAADAGKTQYGKLKIGDLPVLLTCLGPSGVTSLRLCFLTCEMRTFDQMKSKVCFTFNILYLSLTGLRGARTF